MSWWWRLRHSWGWRVVLLAARRDPLCRASDRAEAAAVVSAAVLSIVAIPLAVVVGLGVLDSSLATVHRESLHRHPVVATVRSTSTSFSLRYGEESRAKVDWTRSDGRAMSATVRLYSVPKVGNRVTIWTDDQGRVVTKPFTTSQAETQALAAGLGVGLGGLALILSSLWIIQHALLRRRVRAWDAEWIDVGSRPLR